MKHTKKKNKIILNKLTPYIINSLITILIFILTLAINDIEPIGKLTLATNDAIFQYQPMLYNFINSIKEGILNNYTFLNGLGSSFFFNYVYYLSSPLNLFAIFFKHPATMFAFVILIKIIITTITTTFYTLKKTDNKFISTIISVSYVFSAWFLAYGKTIMWLDAFMMFPLFQYGLEKLLNEHKIYLFIFSLSYIMISNFYLAFMICLYTIIYFIYYVTTKKETISHKLKSFNTISLATGLTLLLSFWYIYITYDSFMRIGLYINNISEDITTISLLNIIKSFFCGNTIVSLDDINSIFPNIALTSIFTISLLYYFINKNIDKKEKIKTLIIFALIIFAIYSKTFNYIFNCFHVPVGFPIRYSFLISFFLIKVFIRNYQTFDNKIYKRTYIINIILAILLIIELLFKNIELKLFIFNITFLCLFTILFIFYKKNKVYKYIFISATLIEIIISCLFNINPSYKTNYSDFSFNTKTTTYREITKYDSEFQLSLNFNMYDNKNSISFFTSMYYTYVAQNLNALGCNADDRAILLHCPETQLFNTFFNIKTNNNYYLEKIFTADNTINIYSLSEENILKNQNILYESTTGINNIFEYNLKKDKDIYTVTKKGTYYALINNKKAIIINDNAYTFDESLLKERDNLTINIVKDSSPYPMLELQLNKNDKIEIIYNEKQMKIEKEKIPEVPYIYYYNEEKFKEAYNILKASEIKYTSYESNKIEGTINVKNNKIIITTIPYDTNWEIKIDGQEVEPIRIFDSLIGVETTPGKHKITMEYKTNFTIPILISLTTFIGLITKIILDKRKQKKNEN